MWEFSSTRRDIVSQPTRILTEKLGQNRKESLSGTTISAGSVLNEDRGQSKGLSLSNVSVSFAWDLKTISRPLAPVLAEGLRP
jgi:hypothetical protein